MISFALKRAVFVGVLLSTNIIKRAVHNQKIHTTIKKVQSTLSVLVSAVLLLRLADIKDGDDTVGG